MSKTIQVILEVNGVVETYEGDYDTLHNNPWDEIVRNKLDYEQEAVERRENEAQQAMTDHEMEYAKDVVDEPIQ